VRRAVAVGVVVLAGVGIFFLGRSTAPQSPAAVVVHGITIYPTTTTSTVPPTTTTTTTAPPPTTTTSSTPPATTIATAPVPDAAAAGQEYGSIGSAVSTLSQAGFGYTLSLVVTTHTNACNDVLGQSPPPGTELPLGSVVTISVAKC
jgi:hypothetical protein